LQAIAWLRETYERCGGEFTGGGLSGKSRGERHAGLALMENERGPCALADDERWERRVYSRCYHVQRAYALVLAQLAGSIVSTAILTMIGLRHWRPMFHFRRADLKGYMGFGLYQMGERTLNFLYSRTDQLLIGMFVGPIALGYYSFSWNLIIQPMNRVNPTLTKVAFPLFARMQNEEERLRRGYLTLIRILATINAPILLGFAANAPVLIPIVYSACHPLPLATRYHPAGNKHGDAAHHLRTRAVATGWQQSRHDVTVIIFGRTRSTSPSTIARPWVLI
jgi:hypothetical protein